MRQIPDISQYELRLTVPDVDLEGVVIPGLTGEYFRREESGRTATAGRYRYAGRELFLSWGYVDEAHCAWTSYRSGAHWTSPHPGCPRITRITGALVLDIGESKIHLPAARRPLAGTSPDPPIASPKAPPADAGLNPPIVSLAAPQPWPGAGLGAWRRR